MPVVVSRELKRVKGSHMCAAPSQAFVTYANTKKTRTHTHTDIECLCRQTHEAIVHAISCNNVLLTVLTVSALNIFPHQSELECLPIGSQPLSTCFASFLITVSPCLNPPTGTSRPYRRNKHPQHHQTYSPLRISQFLTHCSFTTPFSFSLYLPSFRPLPLGFQFLVLYSFVPCRGGRSRSKWSRFHQGRRWSCWCCCDWRWSRRRQTWGGADVIWD